MQSLIVIDTNQSKQLEQLDIECKISAMNSDLIQNSESDSEFRKSRLENIKYIRV